MTEEYLKLKDHRLLRYGIFGNPKGVPVIDFHGIPGSYLEAELIHSYIGRDDVCLVGFDRPGYGKSSPRLNFQVQDIASDVLELIDHLNINRFAALGFSGGGPFALACSCLLPDRVGALGIVSGVGPADTGSDGMHESNRKKFNLAQQLPWLARIMLWLAFTNLRLHPDDLAGQMEKIWQQMPGPDRKLLFGDQKFRDG
ncbi:MAG: alpha/beta fold hydrolase, partial [Chloroflexota bacterium]